jgi:hypothetical protein
MMPSSDLDVIPVCTVTRRSLNVASVSDLFAVPRFCLRLDLEMPCEILVAYQAYIVDPISPRQPRCFPTR